ncbi:MAG: SRPBCC domain-containing protein [Chloroflexi bacterium]|nr:SRPBCC domain-containing protein [Chloroflexota bacterium]
MEPIAIERSIWIAAPRERVWQALTDPDQVEQWFAPGTTFKSSGSEVGAKLYVENPETGEEMYVQVLEVVDPPHRLVLRSQSAPPDPTFYTSYRLEAENGGTRLIFTFSGYEGLPQEIRQQMMSENDAGFELMLGNIKAYIEGTPLPNPQGF